ncbi:TetR/AcrR family transcriptional regulator [Nonomuraea sp. NPDC050790]|uniref:TetR/AcrR family transcriptional regulator n=1 Tax=Nonomuraea sp. NPDC050790 TaxID=3364371 RepID=UPI0037B016E1
MPRQVDHQQRRTLVARALWRVIAEQGLEAASLREVAAAAGVSIGQLQHYFGSKESMLRFTIEQLAEETGGRILNLAAAGGPVLDVLRRVVAELVPSTPERRIEQSAWTAFLAHSAVDHEIARILRDQYRASRAVLEQSLRHAQAAGEVGPSVDPGVAAATLLALVDGLSIQAELDDLDPALIDHALDAHFARLREAP